MILLDDVPGVRLGPAFAPALGALRAASAYTTASARARPVPSSLGRYTGFKRRVRFGPLGATVTLAIALSVIGDDLLTGYPSPPLPSTAGFDTAPNIDIVQRDKDGEHVLGPLSGPVTTKGDFGQGDLQARPSFSGCGDLGGGGQTEGPPSSDHDDDDLGSSGGSEDSSGSGSFPPVVLGDPFSGNDSSGSPFLAVELRTDIITGSSLPGPPALAYALPSMGDHLDDISHLFYPCSFGAVVLVLTVHLVSKRRLKRRGRITRGNGPSIGQSTSRAPIVPSGTNASGITIVEIISSDDADFRLNRLVSYTVFPVCDTTWSAAHVNLGVPFCGLDQLEHPPLDNSCTEIHLDLPPEKDLASTVSVIEPIIEVAPTVALKESPMDMARDFIVAMLKRRLLAVLLSLVACMVYLIRFFDPSELVELSQMMEKVIEASRENLVVDAVSGDCQSGAAGPTVIEAVEDTSTSELITCEDRTIQRDPSLPVLKEGLRGSSSDSALHSGNHISNIDSFVVSTQPVHSSFQVTGSVSSPSVLGTLHQRTPTSSEGSSTTLRAEASPFIPAGDSEDPSSEEKPSAIPVVSLTRRKPRARGIRTHGHAGRGGGSKRATGSKMAIIGNF